MWKVTGKRVNRGASYTAQKMKFSIKDFFSKCDQIRSFLRIWSHLLRKSFMENFIFCGVYGLEIPVTYSFTGLDKVVAWISEEIKTTK